MNLHGRVAWVTGAGRGIGAATARALGAAGCRVLVSARTQAEIDVVADEIVRAGGEAIAVTGDVTVEEDVTRLVAAVEERLGPIEILVNNAGNATSNRLGRTTLEEWRRLLDVNATSTFLCTRAVYDGMVERGWGRVVNVASMAALEGKRYVSAYTAAKHAVLGFTRAVAAEAAGTGVQVGAVCPGYVGTPLTDGTVARVVERTGKSPEEALRAVLAAADQDRLITMEEVAAAILDLCADGPDDHNGELVVLDGKEGLPVSFEHINPAALGEPKGWTNGMLGASGGQVLFIAGQDAAEPEGEVTTDDFTMQFGLALEQAPHRGRGGGRTGRGHRAHDHLRDRSRRVSRGAGAVGGRLPGVHGPALPGHVPGRGEAPRGPPRARRDRGHRRDSRRALAFDPPTPSTRKHSCCHRSPFATSTTKPPGSAPSRSTVPTASTRSRSKSTTSCAARSIRFRTTRPRARLVITGSGRAFCSGGDVEDIIGALFDRGFRGLLDFTRMTCDLVLAIRKCRKPVIGALNGTVAGAGAVIATACDMRVAAEAAKIAYLFTRVGLSGADMGAAWMLPRIVGLAKASELLMTGDFISAEEAHRIGLYNRVVPDGQALAAAQGLAAKLARGPSFALEITKDSLNREAHMDLPGALEAEAQIQASLMLHPDFREAYEAFVAKRDAEFL